MTTMTSVTSSNISSVGHDGIDLVVTFNNGRTYKYLSAPYSILKEILQAPSAGKFLNEKIKPVYSAVQV